LTPLAAGRYVLGGDDALPEPTLDDPIKGGGTPAGGPFGRRRRQWVVDARYQLRAGVLVGTVAIVLLVLLNASLMLQDHSAAAPAGIAAKTVRPVFAGQDRVSWALLLAGSAVFLGGVILVGLLESHRTAGAAFAIRRAVDAIRDGRSQIRVLLRGGDHLKHLAESINQLAETIDADRLRRG
jgi:hypothetical protein